MDFVHEYIGTVAIEVIGPPAAGKTTFLETLAPSMEAIGEPLLELNTSGVLPAQSGITRQKAVIDHVLMRLAQAGDEVPLIDSGIIYLLAFGQMRFSRDPELKGLFRDTETAARYINARFSGIIRLNAPLEVLEKHKSADISRPRRSFQQNVRDFRSISRLVDELICRLGHQFLFDVHDSGDANQLKMARQWALSRSRHLPLADVVAAAEKSWTPR